MKTLAKLVFSHLHILNIYVKIMQKIINTERFKRKKGRKRKREGRERKSCFPSVHLVPFPRISTFESLFPLILEFLNTSQ